MKNKITKSIEKFVDFSVEKIGKYQVVVEAVDTYGKRSRQRFQLPVLPQTGMQEGEEL